MHLLVQVFNYVTLLNGFGRRYNLYGGIADAYRNFISDFMANLTVKPRNDLVTLQLKTLWLHHSHKSYAYMISGYVFKHMSETEPQNFDSIETYNSYAANITCERDDAAIEAICALVRSQVAYHFNNLERYDTHWVPLVRELIANPRQSDVAIYLTPEDHSPPCSDDESGYDN